MRTYYFCMACISLSFLLLFVNENTSDAMCGAAFCGFLSALSFAIFIFVEDFDELFSIFRRIFQ